MNLSSYVYYDSEPQKQRDYMSKKRSIVQEESLRAVLLGLKCVIVPDKLPSPAVL